MKYFLDFDRTLLDTDAFKAAQAERHGPEHLGKVASLEGVNVSSFLFEDAVRFLEAHDRNDLFVVSSCHGITGTWDIEFQREKLRASGVASFVESVHVVEDTKAAIIASLVTDERAVFVDDLRLHLTAVKDAVPDIAVVHIQRENVLHEQTDERETLEPMAVISSLMELDAIIGV